MQEVLSETHSILKEIVQEVKDLDDNFSTCLAILWSYKPFEYVLAVRLLGQARKLDWIPSAAGLPPDS
ncbi:hypothetical protein Taro_016655 [Colocasia esculenta]|uniref:Uncharacterized protein n=1 Tax=Colocasia esculenta TaxID=4460 RepID=A0A843ULB5_COLES|nr:hypothetical protein [Colocasia esculenta]